MTTRRSFQILFLLIVFATILIFPVWVILTWSQTPTGLVIQSRVVEESVPAGGTAHLKGYSSAPKNCNVYVFRSIHDSNGVQIGVLNEFSPASSGPTISSIDLPIPSHATPGKAIIYSTVQWSCNWPQRIFPRTRQIPNLELIILEPNGGG